MAGRKSDFTLPKFDDIFSTQEMRDDEKLAKIRDIPLELIDDFPDHPYKVRDDEDMMQLAESIKERGVITPATVRQKEDGRYELISGHRRKRASELAGFETLRCEVVDLTRDEAIILMVESNFQRSQILPSEKAFAYKMRSEAMKRTAGRPQKENSSPVGIDLRGKQSLDLMSEECGDSRNQIHRYIRLDGLNTVMPYGTRKIDTFRTLTTESLAVFIPFRVQDIFHEHGIYYGTNVISKNMIIADRRQLLNGNSFILGVSGSGKSFTAKGEITDIIGC